MRRVKAILVSHIGISKYYKWQLTGATFPESSGVLVVLSGYACRSEAGLIMLFMEWLSEYITYDGLVYCESCHVSYFWNLLSSFQAVYDNGEI